MALISNQDSCKEASSPQNKYRQNTLSLSNVTGTAWCWLPSLWLPVAFVLRCWGGQALQCAWIRGEAGGWSFHAPCIRQYRILHSLADKPFTSISWLLGRSLGTEYHEPATTWHVLRQPRVAHLTQHPFRPRKLLLHSPCWQASRVGSLRFCSQPRKQLENLVVVVVFLKEHSDPRGLCSSKRKVVQLPQCRFKITVRSTLEFLVTSDKASV